MLYEPATGPCVGRAKPGTANLYAWVLGHSGRFLLAGNGIYVCRPPRGGTGFSVHAEGRAFDINRALPSGLPDGSSVPLGSPADALLRSWVATLERNHEALGVQRILYKSINWRCDHGYTKSSLSLSLMHANHMHVEQTRSKAETLTTAQIAAVLGTVPPSGPDPTTEAEVSRTVMVPGGQPNSVGRWPFWMLTASGNEVVSCNGAPALAGSTQILGSPVVTIPTPHRPIIGIEAAPDGNGIIACADDQSTYTLRKQ